MCHRPLGPTTATGPAIGRCAAGENGGGPGDGPKLVLGDARRGDGTVRERGEAAVRREEHAIGAEELDGPPGLRDDLLRRLHPLELLVDDADADPAARGQVLQDVDLSRPRGAELEEERADPDRREERQERPVVARQRRALVARPVAAADVQGEARGRQAGHRLGDQGPCEAQLRQRVALLAQGAAHEAPAALGAGEDDLGEHGLVELDEARAGCEQEVNLLAQHAHDVRGQVLARAVRAVGDALHPHRAREEIRAGQGHLHRPVGERAREGELVNRQGPAPAEAPEHGGMAHLGGGHVERSQLGLEHLGIVDQGQQVGEWDELAIVEAAAHEARVVVAPLLAVGHHVDARPELGLHGEARRVLGRGVELRVGEPPLHVRVDGLPHPARSRPASHAHDGERRNRGRRGGRGQDGRNADGDRAPLGHEAARRRRRALDPLGEPALADQKAPLAPAPDERDQFVPGHAAPGGEILLHRDLRGAKLEKLAARERIDVLADQQEQAIATVEITPVKARVGLQGVPFNGVHRHRLLVVQSENHHG